MQALKVPRRRLKFWWHLLVAYITRYRLRILFFLICLILVLAGLYKFARMLTNSNVLSLGYVGDYSLETIPAQALYLAAQPLIGVDEKGKPVPVLASNWTVSEDGKTYVVFLKDNLKWQDSTQVAAKDISIALKGVEITALNNKAIQFKLPNPISSFPLALNKPVFKANSFYGTGEYKIVAIDQKSNVIRKIAMIPKNKKLPNVEIKFYSTEQKAINALKIGEVKTVSAAGLQSIQSWPNLKLQKEINDSEIITVFLNNDDPILSSKEVRMALSFAINKSSFDGIPAPGPISTSSWAFSENLKRYDYNPIKAKELLKKNEVKNSKITLAVTPGLEDVAAQIKEDWQAVGIDTDIKVEKTIPKSFQALLAVDKLNPDPDQYSLWHSTQTKTNITNYKNVKIDKLLEDARAIQDEGKRRDLYFDFQRYILEDAPAIFLYHPYEYKITYKNSLNLIQKLPKTF